MHTKRPLLAITIGDPAGIGPETIVGEWSDPDVHRWCNPVVIGHPVILERAVALLGRRCEIAIVNDVADARSAPDRIACLACGSESALAAPPATIDPRSGQAAYEAIVAARRSWRWPGRSTASSTAPLHKAALWQAGHHYPGHTELLAELCGVQDFAMMLYLGPGRA